MPQRAREIAATREVGEVGLHRLSIESSPRRRALLCVGAVSNCHGCSFQLPQAYPGVIVIVIVIVALGVALGAGGVSVGEEVAVGGAGGVWVGRGVGVRRGMVKRTRASAWPPVLLKTMMRSVTGPSGRGFKSQSARRPVSGKGFVFWPI